MVKIESKEKLAKLLAMEDLDVQHKQVPTAYFDVTNRTLILPTWKDMPNHLYDLLVGHEVGHALFTPTSEKILRTLIEKTSKHCVNIVEDARIENLVKRKYPGLRKQFFNGYTDLVEKDFFGINTIDPNTMKFLDKINMHFKIPTHIDIDFTDEQTIFVERIEKAKTFNDVSEICIDLAEYIKENPEIDPESDTDNHQENEEENDENSIGEENDEESTENDSESSDKNEKSSDGSGSDDGSGNKNSEGESEEVDEDLEKDGEETKSGNNTNQDTPETGKSEPSSPTAEDNLDDGLNSDDGLTSDTYNNFENNISDLVEKETNNIYLTVPESVNYDSIIDYKKVHSNIDNFYKRENFNVLNDSYSNYDDDTKFKLFKDKVYDEGKLTLSKIKKDSVKNVNHMAMDFERKKCADIYKRTSISKTGVLDTNKLFSAKYNEDVFKKSVKSPEGKNHGLVLFCDWSGSMAYNIEGCIKQLIEMVFFCKKVNIPFEVYSFTDVQERDSKGKYKSFNYNHGDMVMDEDVRLRNYFSSRMSLAELNKALINICIISNAYARGTSGFAIPVEDRLGYTPLAGAILFSEHIIRNFKNKNNVQDVHAVWITDGEGNQSFNKWDAMRKVHVPAHPKESKWDTHYKYYLQDKKTKKNHLLQYGKITDVCFQIVKDRLGINIVGFYIDRHFASKSSLENHYRHIWDSIKPKGHSWDDYRYAFRDWSKKIKKVGYLVKTQRGYDEYYVIDNAVKERKQIQLTEKMTARKMATLFSSQSSQFKNSRVLLSRFIDLITVNS